MKPRTITTTGTQPRNYVNWQVPFKTRGHLRAERFAAGDAPVIQQPPSVYGQVIKRKPWNIYAGRRAQIVYVVYSYDVPIAWVYADGSIERPTAVYSTTTARHKEIASALADERGHWGPRPE